eukprot:10450510-Prorocentrum_lima.AAC.1
MSEWRGGGSQAGAVRGSWALRGRGRVAVRVAGCWNRHGMVTRGRQVGGGWRGWRWKCCVRALKLKLHLQCSVARD